MFEITCLYCGAKATAQRKTMKYCSSGCNNKYRKMLIKQGLIKDRNLTEVVCPHNEGVVCSMKKCSTCGWNPAVARRRMVAHG